MKIDIKPVEKSHGGLFRKRTLHGVELTVLFSEEERAVIEERKLASGLIGTEESFWGFPASVLHATLRDAYWYQHRHHGFGQGSA